MKRFFVFVIVGALVSPGVVSKAFAGITENFSYPDGPLTTSSGGLWQLWAPGSSDAVVSGGVAVSDPGTDVARLFPNELQVVGAVVNYSFDVSVTTPGIEGSLYVVEFSPATLPLTTGQDYLNSLGFSFSAVPAFPGVVNVGRVVGDQNLAWTTMTIGAAHTISGTMTKNATTISYTAQLDGGQVFAGDFPHVNPLGINCFEMFDAGLGPTGGFRLDNLVFIPEPGTLSLFTIAALALIRRRRVNSVALHRG